MTEPLRLAIVGPGDVAQRDYLPELSRIADLATVVAVCGRGESRARATAEQLGASWFTDISQMLEASHLDVVVNLTPIHDHEATTMLCLEAGAHVYSEKPLATSVAGATKLRDEAARRGLVLAAAPSVMLFPQVRLAASMLARGEIGQVHTVRGLGFGGIPPWLGYTSDPSPFFRAGAGPHVDLGVYPLHAITGLLGPIHRVSAMSARTRDGFEIADGPAAGDRVVMEIDDAWVMIAELEGPSLVSLESNFTSHGTRSAELELMGEQGTIALSLLDPSTPLEVLGPVGEWSTREVPGVERSAGPDHMLGVRHLAECIRDRVAPIIGADHAIHVLSVLAAAERSAAEGVHADVAATDWLGPSVPGDEPAPGPGRQGA